MFPLLNRNIPHVEDKILSYLEPKGLLTSMLVCREWCQKARPFLFEWYANYAIIQRKKGRVPLQMAIIDGYDHLVAFLLQDEQVDVNETSKWPMLGRTALMEAIIHGKDRITRILLEREDTDVLMESRYHGDTALSVAAAHGNAGAVKMLLARPLIGINDCSLNGDSALIKAVIAGEASVVEELLKHPGINVNIRDTSGYTALSHAKMEINGTWGTMCTSATRRKIIKLLEDRNAK